MALRSFLSEISRGSGGCAPGPASQPSETAMTAAWDPSKPILEIENLSI